MHLKPILLFTATVFAAPRRYAMPREQVDVSTPSQYAAYFGDYPSVSEELPYGDYVFGESRKAKEMPKQKFYEEEEEVEVEDNDVADETNVEEEQEADVFGTAEEEKFSQFQADLELTMDQATQMLDISRFLREQAAILKEKDSNLAFALKLVNDGLSDIETVWNQVRKTAVHFQNAQVNVGLTAYEVIFGALVKASEAVIPEIYDALEALSKNNFKVSSAKLGKLPTLREHLQETFADFLAEVEYLLGDLPEGVDIPKTIVQQVPVETEPKPASAIKPVVEIPHVESSAKTEKTNEDVPEMEPFDAFGDLFM